MIMVTSNQEQEAEEIMNNNNHQQEEEEVEGLLVTKQTQMIMNKRSVINIGNGKKTLLFRIGRRKKKLPSIRLGGGKKEKRAGFSQQVVRLVKKIKLKWMLKKLQSFYYSMLKDLADANYASTDYDSMQQRIMMESYLSVPVMGVSIVSVPSYIPSKYY